LLVDAIQIPEEPTMKHVIRTLSIALALAAVGCGNEPAPISAPIVAAPVVAAPTAPAAPAAAVKDLDVAAVAALVSAHRATVLDVNGASTRAEYGVVPGAKLLSSSSQFDVATELPADKASTLVFYCANTECGASHHAAERALTAGYSDVNVMRAGIAGWKEAGQATEPAPQS
jgi:rhodanese-related sulfurtransferase